MAMLIGVGNNYDRDLEAAKLQHERNMAIQVFVSWNESYNTKNLRLGFENSDEAQDTRDIVDKVFENLCMTQGMLTAATGGSWEDIAQYKLAYMDDHRAYKKKMVAISNAKTILEFAKTAKEAAEKAAVAKRAVEKIAKEAAAKKAAAEVAKKAAVEKAAAEAAKKAATEKAVAEAAEKAAAEMAAVEAAKKLMQKRLLQTRLLRRLQRKLQRRRLLQRLQQRLQSLRRS